MLEEKQLIAIGLLALFGGSGINLLFPWLLKEILDEAPWLGMHLPADLSRVAAMLIVLFLIQAGFFYARHYYFTAAGYRVVTNLRNRLFGSIIGQDITFFDRSRVGDLLSRLSSDSGLVQRAVSTNVSVVARYSLQAIGGTLLMIFISPKLTVLILLLIPVIAVSSAIFGKRLRKLSKQVQQEIAEAAVIAEECISSIRSVLIFAGKTYEQKHYADASEQALETGLKRTRLAAVFSSSMVFVMNASLALLLWFGGSMLANGNISMGNLTAFLLYGVMVAVSFGFLSGAWDELMQSAGAADRIFEIIEQRPAIVSPEFPLPLPNTAQRSVRFESVSFTYPSRPDVSVLSDVSFTIPAGKTVALVGPSGGGKSTIASLIPRFYDPQSGQIFYADIPVDQLSLDVLRGEISMVTQSPEVFSLSIRDNIGYGCKNVSFELIEQASRAANLHDFIQSLPDKYDTLVGDKGVQLSGGQKQRLTIARAILHDPRLLILDEATSSLDSENEALVQQALNRLIENRTTLVIAHRLSTVQNADEVLVIEHGRIVQRGRHDELYAAEGIYRNLVKHQLL
ncbi:MAG: ABC transporter transmembrane domain-containing protein [bacterium]|nr:ABC transporter transmembrane domain-containing protein [bacterium]